MDDEAYFESLNEAYFENLKCVNCKQEYWINEKDKLCKKCFRKEAHNKNVNHMNKMMQEKLETAKMKVKLPILNTR